MAKQFEPLDIESALAPAPAVPTGGDTGGFEPLDLSVLEDGGQAELPLMDRIANTLDPNRAATQAAAKSAAEDQEAKAAFDANPGTNLGEAGLDPIDRAVGQAGDILGGAISGVVKGTKAAAEGVVELKGAVQEKITGAMFGEDAVSSYGVQQESRDFKAVTDANLSTPAPKTIAGNITQGVSQFIVGMVGTGKLFKAAGVLQGAGKLLGFGRASAQGAIADATVFDPTEERLSNLVEEYPSLSNPITSYLQAAPEDTAAEGRFKNALEGLVLGSAVEALFASIRGVKRIRTARASGGEEAAVKELGAVVDELEAVNAPKAPDAPKAGGEVADTAPAAAPKPDGAVAGTAPAKSNVAPPEQGIKNYIIERLQKGAGLDPDYSVDFNIAKQSTTAGAKETINLMSEALAPEIDKLKGGVQTFEKIKTLANLAGEDPAALLTRMSERASDAKRLASDVVATEEWMLSTARQISDEARKLDNGLVTDPTFLNQMMDNLASTVADLKAVKTGAARATSAGRIVKGEGFSLEQIKALVAAGGDLDQVSKIVQGPSASARILNVHNEYWINSLLSGPKTHLVNMTSNVLNTFARPTEKILGGQMREGLSEFMGISKSLWDSIKMSAKAYWMEESILDPHNLKTDAPRFAISAGNAGLKPNSFMGSSVNWIGKVTRFPSRLLLTEDEFFKQLNYRANIYARATREGVEKGLDGPALANYIESRFQSAFDGAGKGLDDTALKEARISTFTEELDPNGLVGKLNKVANQHPGMRLIVPFIRTPTNIVKQLGHRTPGINLLMKSYREELKAGGGRAAAARGKMATGGMLWGGGVLLAAQGKLTGRGPSSKEERDALLATGWRPYSFKTDDGRYLDYSRIDPFGMALGLAADFTEASGYMDDVQKEGVATAMLAAMSRNLSSKTYLRGMTEFLDVLSQPDKKAEHWINSRVGSYVPSGAKQIAGLIPGQEDPIMREVRSTMDAVYARTPGLSETLPPKRNLLGEPIRYPAGLGPDSISPFAMSKDLNDPVKAELARLSHAFQMPPEKINNGRVDLTKYKNEKGQDAYDRLLELRSIERKGRYTLAERLQAEISSDRYQQLPDGNDGYDSGKLKRVQEILGEYSLATMKRLRKEFPDLDRDIRTDAQNAKAVPRKGLEALQPLLGQ